MRRLFTVLCVVAGLGVAACDNGGQTEAQQPGPNGGIVPPDFNVQRQAALTAFDSCTDLEAYLEDLALAELLYARSGGYYDYDRPSSGWENEESPGFADAGTGGEAPAPGDQGGSSGDGSSDEPDDWTDTNTQTEGVDEADIVKTDGSFLYVVTGRRFQIVDAWPAAEAALVGEVELSDAPAELFLYGDVALLFSRVGQSSLPEGFLNTVRTDRRVSGYLVLTLVDIADRTVPRILRTVYAEGDYVSARLVDGVAHVVLRSSVALDDGYLPYVLPSTTSPTDGTGNEPTPSTGDPVDEPGGVADAGSSADAETPPDATEPADTETPPDATEPADTETPPDAPAFDAGSPEDVPESDVPPATDVETDVPEGEADAGSAPAEDAGSFFGRQQSALSAAEAETMLRELFEARTIEDWMPRYYDVAADGSVRTGLLASCDSVFQPATPFGQQLLAVLSLDLDRPDAPQETTAVIGGADVVYASQAALYVAAYKANYWYYWNYGDLDETQRDQSVVHKFSIADGATRAEYRASADVEGHALNQFALDEYDGYLRIVTQTEWRADAERGSRLAVLAEQEDELVEVGAVSGIGRGEDLKAVRFLGPRAFVVTFMQIDPLFAIDLSDPTAPRQVGELEVPGFSTYLHPFDDTHLLAVGEASIPGSEIEIPQECLADPSLCPELPSWCLPEREECTWNYEWCWEYFAEQAERPEGEPERELPPECAAVPESCRQDRGACEENPYWCYGEAMPSTCWLPDTWGVQLSLFDVSDLAEPRRVQNAIIGGASSEAQYDHRAFTFFRAPSVLVVPVQGGYDGSDPYFSGLHVYDVSIENGFALRGTVDHRALGDTFAEALGVDLPAQPDDCWNDSSDWQANETCSALFSMLRQVPVRRSLFIETFLYSISALGVQVNDLGQLAPPVAVVPLADECDLLPSWSGLRPETCPADAWSEDKETLPGYAAD